MGKGQADRERAQDRHDATCKGLKGLTLHPGPGHHHRALIQPLRLSLPSISVYHLTFTYLTTSPRTLTPLSCPDQPIPPACLPARCLQVPEV